MTNVTRCYILLGVLVHSANAASSNVATSNVSHLPPKNNYPKGTDVVWNGKAGDMSGVIDKWLGRKQKWGIILPSGKKTAIKQDKVQLIQTKTKLDSRSSSPSRTPSASDLSLTDVEDQTKCRKNHTENDTDEDIVQREAKPVFFNPSEGWINDAVKRLLFKKGTLSQVNLTNYGYCWYMALLNILAQIETDIDTELGFSYDNKGQPIWKREDISEERRACWVSIKLILRQNPNYHEQQLEYARGLVDIYKMLGNEHVNMLFTWGSCPSKIFKDKMNFQTCDCNGNNDGEITKHTEVSVWDRNGKSKRYSVTKDNIGKETYEMKCTSNRRISLTVPKRDVTKRRRSSLVQLCVYRPPDFIAFSGTKKISTILSKLLGKTNGDVSGEIVYMRLDEIDALEKDAQEKLRTEYELVGVSPGYFRTINKTMHQVAWMKYDGFKLYDSGSEGPTPLEMDAGTLNFPVKKFPKAKKGAKSKAEAKYVADCELSRHGFMALTKLVGAQAATEMQGFKAPAGHCTWYLRGIRKMMVIYRRK
jgi:hypothetical protein